MRYFQAKSRSSDHSRICLIFNEKEWNKLHETVKEAQKTKEMAEEEANRRAAKKEKCKQSTEKWPNTLTSIKKERDKKLIEAAKKVNEEMQEDYRAILKEHEKQRNEIIENAKKIIFERTEDNRIITSGLVLSAILQEREKQIALRDEQRQQEVAAKQEEIEVKREMARKHAEEIEQYKKNQLHQQKLNMQIMDQQMKEVIHKREQEEAEKALEKIDSDDMRKEWEQLQVKEAKVKAEKKKKLREEQEQWAALTETFKQQRQKEERERNERNSIYQAVREKLDKLRAEKEKQLRAEIIQRREKVPLVMRPHKTDFNKEEELLQVAVKENNEKLEQEQRQRIQKRMQLRKEIEEFEKESIQAAAQKAKEEAEVQRMDILQRLALEEKDREWRQQQLNTKAKKQKDIRDELLVQWEEIEKKEREERLRDVGVYEKASEHERSELLKYCEQVEKTAAVTGGPIYPVLAAIQKVKKSAGLLDDKKKVPFLQSRVPIPSVSIYNK